MWYSLIHGNKSKYKGGIVNGANPHIGQKPVKDAYVLVGQLATVFYFLFFIVLIPVIGIVETKLVDYIRKTN